MHLKIAQHGSPGREEERKDKLRYIQSMIREVRDLSAPERCSLVTYFLELAYIEVSDEIRKIHKPQR